MFGQVSHHMIRHQLSNAKNFIGHHYGRTKAVLGQVDRYISMGKNVYRALEPAINAVAASNPHVGTVNKHIKRGLSGYETIKNKIKEVDDHANQALHHYNNTVSGLQKTRVGIGLD